MACLRCGSSRIAEICAKCSDMSDITVGNNHHDGYVIDGMGIGSGDYVEFNWCLNCGQIQGPWPVPESELERVPEVPTVDPEYVEYANMLHDVVSNHNDCGMPTSSLMTLVMTVGEDPVAFAAGITHLRSDPTTERWAEVILDQLSDWRYFTEMCDLIPGYWD